MSFKAIKNIDDAKLREKIAITTGSIADAVLIQDNANKLRSFYEEEGYWLASIIRVIKNISTEEVGLTYQIDEGPKVNIDKIVMEGNKALSTKQIKKVLSTKEWGIFSFITSSGYYKKDQMDLDIEKIRDLYFNNGYIKVTVGEPKINLTADKKKMIITILIAEGSQYKVSSVRFSGNKIFSDDVIKGNITLLPNKPFSKLQLRRDILSLAELYSENGYAVATIVPDLIPDENNKLVEVDSFLAESPVPLLRYWLAFVFAIPYWCLALYANGLYQSIRTRAYLEILWAVVKAAAVTFLLLGTFIFLFKLTFMSRLFFVLFMGFSFLFIWLEKTAIFMSSHYVRRQGLKTRRLLIVGTGRRAEAFVKKVDKHPEWGFEILGAIDDEPGRGVQRSADSTRSGRSMTSPGSSIGMPWTRLFSSFRGHA